MQYYRPRRTKMQKTTKPGSPDLIAMLALAKVTESDVMMVYSGKAGGCWCGCRGSYRYRPETQAAGTARRGYAVDADEVNAKQVRKVLALLKANPTQVESFGDGFSMTLGNRDYGVYLNA
jgi:hypothetical protein